MDGEEKRENQRISFVERINRESGRVSEDPKKHSKKNEVWVLEDVTGNEYVSDVSSAAGRQTNSSWMKRGKNLFEELFFEGRLHFLVNSLNLVTVHLIFHFISSSDINLLLINVFRNYKH